MSVTVLVLLVLAMMLGPVLMIMPSRGQSRIAALRQDAAIMGLHVSMGKPAGADKPDIATYTLAWNTPPKRGVGCDSNLVLLKQASSHGLHFHGVWDYESRKAQQQHGLTSAQFANMKQYLDQLPPEILGVAITRQGATVYWRERFASSSDKNEMLAIIAGLLRRLSAVVIDL